MEVTANKQVYFLNTWSCLLSLVAYMAASGVKTRSHLENSVSYMIRAVTISDYLIYLIKLLKRKLNYNQIKELKPDLYQFLLFLKL